MNVGDNIVVSCPDASIAKGTVILITAIGVLFAAKSPSQIQSVLYCPINCASLDV